MFNTIDPPIEDTISSGINLVKQGHYLEALDRLQRHIENYPNHTAQLLIPLYRILRIKDKDIQLKSLIAQLYIAAKRYPEAVEEIEDIIELNYEHIQSYFLLRKIYNKGLFEEKIIHLYEQAFEKNILDSSILDLLPKVYLETNNFDKGTLFFEKIITHRPGNLQYYKTLVSLYIKSNRFTDAGKTYATIIELAPDTAGEAALQTEHLSQQDPDNIQLHTYLVDFYLKSMQPDEAAQHLDKLTILCKDSLETVIKHYKHALESYPKTASLQIGLSQSLVLQGHYTEASQQLSSVFAQTFDHTEKVIPLLKDILQKCPEQILAMQLLCDIYLSTSQPTDALHYLTCLSQSQIPPIDFIEKTVHAIYAKYSDYRGEAGLVLAKSYLRLGNEDACKKECQNLYNTSSHIAVKLIEVELLENKEQFQESIQTLQPLAKQFPESKEVHDTLRQSVQKLIEKKLSKTDPQNFHEKGMLNLYSRNLLAAIDSLQKIPMAHKDYQHSQILIGRCFLELGRFDMSINQLNRALNQCDPADQKTANLLRFVIGLNHLYLGDIAQALQTFETILEFDIHFPNASELIHHLKQYNLLDLRGRTISGCYCVSSDSVCIVSVHNSEEDHHEESHLQKISFAHPHNNQGVEHIFKQNIKSAEAELVLASQMDPQLTSAHCNLSIVRLMQNNFEAALKHLEKAEEINKKLDIIYLNRGLIFAKQHQWDAAVEHYQKALKLNPKNSIAHFNLGDAFYEQNHIKLAFQHWKKATEFGTLFHLVQNRIYHMAELSFENKKWIDSTALDIDIFVTTP